MIPGLNERKIYPGSSPSSPMSYLARDLSRGREGGRLKEKEEEREGGLEKEGSGEKID